MKLVGKSIHSAAAMMCAATIVAVLRAGAQSTDASADWQTQCANYQDQGDSYWGCYCYVNKAAACHGGHEHWGDSHPLLLAAKQPEKTPKPAGSPASSPQTPRQAGALAGAIAAQVGANLAGPVAQAPAQQNNASDRKPETVALPPGEKVFAYTMGSDGVRRTIVKRADGTLYVLGGQPVPRSGPNNYLNRPLGEEPIPQTQERPGTGNPHAVQGSDHEDPNAKRPTFSEEREKALREGVVRKAAQSGQGRH